MPFVRLNHGNLKVNSPTGRYRFTSQHKTLVNEPLQLPAWVKGVLNPNMRRMWYLRVLTVAITSSLILLVVNLGLPSLMPQTQLQPNSPCKPRLTHHNGTDIPSHMRIILFAHTTGMEGQHQFLQDKCPVNNC